MRLGDRNGEGFRMPSGVRKPPMHEHPRACGDGLWGFRFLAERDDGRSVAAMLSAGDVVSKFLHHATFGSGSGRMRISELLSPIW